jgi:hypothetical protein
MNCCIETSNISCGVDQIYDFPEADDTSPSDLFVDMAAAIWFHTLDNEKYQSMDAPNREGPYGIDNLCAATFMFSDNNEGAGWQLGKWLKRRWPKQVQCAYARNPNSGMQIGTFMWTPSARELLDDPLWIRGFRRNVEQQDWASRYTATAATFKHDPNYHETLEEMRRIWAAEGKADPLATLVLK